MLVTIQEKRSISIQKKFVISFHAFLSPWNRDKTLTINVYEEEGENLDFFKLLGSAVVQFDNMDILDFLFQKNNSGQKQKNKYLFEDWFRILWVKWTMKSCKENYV